MSYYVSMFDKGLVQVYTGDGKGKTTAALGLALRAAGHGGRVLICQFLKPSSLSTGERAALRQVDGITLRVFDEPWDMSKSFNDKQAVAAMREKIHSALAEITNEAAEKTFNMIVLDEIVFCLDRKLASMEDIKKLLETKDKSVELVLTGRGAGDELIALADLVTRMQMVKHPYEKGIDARKGIEF